jgi:hypothetical protein
MIPRSGRSEEPSVSDGLTVQTLPNGTLFQLARQRAAVGAGELSLLFRLAPTPQTHMHNNECPPTSGVRTLSAGSQIAAVTFP